MEFIIVFAVILGIRWSAHIALTRHRAGENPGDVITVLLLAAYLGLGVAAFSIGTIDWSAIALLAIGSALRIGGILQLRKNFAYSAAPGADIQLIDTGIYGRHRNPLLLGYALELIAFVVTLPIGFLPVCTLSAFCLFICAWHAAEDNKQLLLYIKGYPDYASRVGNAVLDWVWPTRAKLIDNERMSFDTYGLYIFVGFLAAQIATTGYGVDPFIHFAVMPAAVIGAFGYWRLTRRDKNVRFGFAFFGGLMGASAAAILFLYLTGALNLHTLNLLGLGVALGHGIGRFGCIGHGCCTGRDRGRPGPWVVLYPDPNQRINRVLGTDHSYCFPTVVMEILGQTLILLMIGFFLERGISIWMIGYGTLRMLTQSVRREAGDITRIVPAGVLVAAGAGLLALPVGEVGYSFAMPGAMDLLMALGISGMAAVSYGFRLKQAPTVELVDATPSEDPALSAD